MGKGWKNDEQRKTGCLREQGGVKNKQTSTVYGPKIKHIFKKNRERRKVCLYLLADQDAFSQEWPLFTLTMLFANLSRTHTKHVPKEQGIIRENIDRSVLEGVSNRCAKRTDSADPTVDLSRGWKSTKQVFLYKRPRKNKVPPLMVTLCDSHIAKVDNTQNPPFFAFFIWESLDHMCFHPIFHKGQHL